MVEVNLASDLGYGIPWLRYTLIIAIIIGVVFFTYVILSTRRKSGDPDNLWYKLQKYHTERFWATGTTDCKCMHHKNVSASANDIPVTSDTP